jgi:hypothetical protein
MKRKPYVLTENMKPPLVAEMIARAYDEGYEDGKKDGYDEGFKEGQNLGTAEIDWSKIPTYPTTPGVIYCGGAAPDTKL